MGTYLSYPRPVDDQTLVDTWVQMMLAALAEPAHS